MSETPSPVEFLARQKHIPVETPASLKNIDIQKRLASYDPQVIVVVAYGLLLPQAVLDIPSLACLNLHASLLPRWRGAAPIQRAIMSGDEESGVVVMRMEAGLDTGPVAKTIRVAITPEMTTGTLSSRLAELGGGLMVQALDDMESGTLEFTPQPAEGVSYAHKIDKSEARIVWTRPAVEICRLVHGLAPFPGAWFLAGKERIKLLGATLQQGEGVPGMVLDTDLTIACGKGAIRPLLIQKAGSKPMDRQAFLRGTSIAPGTQLDPGITDITDRTYRAG